jgi:drug/metabolite transporter (DMT)-like permease
MTPRAVAYVVLLLAQLAIGSAALLARHGLQAGLSALSLSAWRLTVAAVLLALWPAPARSTARPPVHAMARLIVAGLCLALHFATWFASLALIPVARSTLLVTTSPLWAGLAGRLFLAHAITRRFWIGLAIASIGVALVTGGAGALAAAGGAAGDLLALTGAALMAAYLLLVEDLQASLSTRRVVIWTCSTAALSLWLPALAGALQIALPSTPAAWLSILGMALIPQLIGHTALNWSLRHFPAGVVGAATLLEPVFAAALAWALLGETLTLTQLAGAAILLAGVALAVTSTPSPDERVTHQATGSGPAASCTTDRSRGTCEAGGPR